MPSLLHVADEHIDSDVHGTLNSTTGRSTAWESNASVIRYLAEKAVELGVDAYISSGDEFKSGRPSQEALLMLADAMTPLAEAGIPILLLDGNHNRISVASGHRSAIHTLAEVLRARGGTVVASAHPELVDVGPFQVATLPWLNKNAVLGVNDLSPADGDKKVADFAIAELERLASGADTSRPLVMAGHVTVAGAPRGSEQDVTHLFSEPILNVAKLEALPFQYGALGHIHTPQSVGNGTYRYAGSPNRLTFTDEPDIKGGNLVRLDGALTVEQVVTPARVLRTIDLGVEGFTAEIDALPEGALVGMILAEGETELPRKIRQRVAGVGGHIVATKPRPVVRAATSRVRLDQAVTMEDALRAFAREREIEDVDSLVKAAADLPGGGL